MNVVEAGSGPDVVLLHGFANYSHSWRHQVRDLAAAGYHVLAPDLRGYGETARPDGVEQYSVLHLVGDVVGLLDAFRIERATVVGHGWGAVLAWNTALMRPDRVRGVVGMSAPVKPDCSNAATCASKSSGPIQSGIPLSGKQSSHPPPSGTTGCHCSDPDPRTLRSVAATSRANSRSAGPCSWKYRM